MENSDYQIESIAGQCFAAFGQGAAPLNISLDAVAFLRTRFIPIFIDHYVADWPQHELKLLNLARVVAYASAHNAAAAGHAEIDTNDVTVALDRLRPTFPTPTRTNL
jgi:hypothetical protein